MPKTSPKTSPTRFSLVIALLTALLLGAGASAALAAGSSRSHSGRTLKQFVTTARKHTNDPAKKHRKHPVKKVTKQTASQAAAAATKAGPKRKRPPRPAPTTTVLTTTSPTTTTPTTTVLTTTSPTTTTPTTTVPTTTTSTTTTPTTTVPTTTTSTTTSTTTAPTLSNMVATVNSDGNVEVAVDASSNIVNVVLYQGNYDKVAPDATAVDGTASFNVTGLSAGSYTLDAVGFTVPSGQPGGQTSAPVAVTVTIPSTPTTTTTTPTTTTTTPTAPPATSGLAGCTTSAPADPQPNGLSGTWTPLFDDEFNGSSVNTNAWSTDNGWPNQNNVTDYASNINVTGGCAALTLASSSSGAQMATTNVALQVGDYAEARIQFAGSGTTVDNWPAFWASGPGWPAAGEQDIFEGLGDATVNYHYAVNGNNTQAGPFNIPGNWAGSFHTYGIYRGSNYCNVYWDGQLVKTYPTADDGQPETIILTEGSANTLSFGASGQMLVDYVRLWQQS